MSENFAELPPELSRTLVKRGFQSLTPVQSAVMAQASGDADLRISSQTGSGKTVAVGIAIARALLAEGPRQGKPFGRAPSVILLTPTRELAAQVQRELEWLLAEIPDASVDVVTGGTSLGLERKRLANGPRVIVGTPGRLLDHLSAGAFDGSKTTTVVLDEADQMLDMGFRDELEGILEKIPHRLRTHLVSATFSGEVERMASKYQSNPLRIEGTPLGQANQDIEHIAHVVDMRHRFDALVNILLLAAAKPEEEIGRTLVFTRTRADTLEVAEKLVREGIRAEPMSGDLPQAQRTRTLKAFRTGQITTIVATDVAARGLDVQGVSLVVHYDPPSDADTMTHRSGRTGRAGQKGTSVLLLPPQARRRIERLLNDAKIKATFGPVPAPSKIIKAYQKLGRRRVYAALEAELQKQVAPEQIATPGDDSEEFVQKLLADRSPELVIKALLSLLEVAPPCPPREVVQALEHHGHHPRDRDRGRPPRSGFRPDRPPRPFQGEPRPKGPAPDRGRPGPSRSSPFAAPRPSSGGFGGPRRRDDRPPHPDAPPRAKIHAQRSAPGIKFHKGRDRG
jgi:ATP-dependent RNA helicase DeaD